MVRTILRIFRLIFPKRDCGLCLATGRYPSANDICPACGGEGTL